MKITDFKENERFCLPEWEKDEYSAFDGEGYLIDQDGGYMAVSVDYLIRDDWEPYETDADKLVRLKRLLVVEVERGNAAFRDGGIAALREAEVRLRGMQYHEPVGRGSQVVVDLTAEWKARK